MFIVLMCLACAPAVAFAAVDHLQVEYRDKPIGIDVPAPRFSWQSVAAPGQRGYRQSAYQIVVRDADNNIVWDTGKVRDARSLGIAYHGAPLQPATQYAWTVTAWDAGAHVSSAQSTFETGLLDDDPALAAWEGATWIGGTNDDLVLHAHTLPIYRLSYRLAIASGSPTRFVDTGRQRCAPDESKPQYFSA